MRETKDASVGKEFKAVAQDVLRLGAQCVQAGRVWLNERREEMTNPNDEFRRDNPSTYGTSGDSGWQQQQNRAEQYQQGQRYQGQQQDMQGQRHQSQYQDQQGQRTYNQQHGMQGQSRYTQPHSGGSSNYEGYGSQASGGYQQERYQDDFDTGQRMQGAQVHGYQEPFHGQGSERFSWDEGRGYAEQGRYAQSEYGQRNLAGIYGQQDTMGANIGGRGYGQGYGTSSGYGQRPRGYGQGFGNQDLGASGLGSGLSYQGYRNDADMSGYRGQGPSQFGAGEMASRMPGNLQSHRGRGPKNYTRSDERIVDDLNERLTNDDDIDASEIEVKSLQGVVTLEGTVEERWMKHRVEDIADACGGVREVVNHLTVAATSARNDEGRPENRSARSTASQSTSRSGTQPAKPGSTSGSAH